MASILPGFKSLSLPGRKVLLHREGLVLGNDVILNGSVVADTGNGLARTSLIRQGAIVCKKTSDGLYYLATDGANGDRCAPASASTATGISAAWASSTFTFTLSGGVSFTVVTDSSATTNAATVTELNANAVFAASFVADVNATAIRIRTLAGGAGVYFTVSSTVANSFGAGVTSASAGGTDADYRVLGPGGSAEEIVDLLGPDAAAANAPARNAYSGHFILANLLYSTPEALAVLARRGSMFG